MLFNVPQFIDIEDKIVGPLTAKQLGWLAAGGVLLLVFWNYLDNQAFIIAAIIIGIIFGALAFYRPYNQPLIKFIGSSIVFVIRPKVYLWKRFQEKITKEKKLEQPTERKISKKVFDQEKIMEISNIVDKRK